MKLLLDTHIWLWSLVDPDKLSQRVAKALRDQDNELWLSSISAWEALMLCEKGRIRVKDEPGIWVTRALKQIPLREAPVTHEIALASMKIRLPYRDPADRFLSATAVTHGFTLVTADKRLIEARQSEILSN